MLKKKDKKKGWCIQIEGLSGSGKTTLSIKIKSKVEKLIGRTVILDGDSCRSFFKLAGYKGGYTKKDRAHGSYSRSALINLFNINMINVIHPMVGLNEKGLNIFKKKIKNFILVYIKSNVNQIKKFGKKNAVYKLKKNVVGVDILADIPKNPHIVIDNNFTRSTDSLSKELIYKLKKLFT